MKELNDLNDKQVLEALHELQRWKWYIRSGNKHHMDLDVKLMTLDDHPDFKVKALVDSGYTGSSIEKHFMGKNKINTKKYP